MDRQLLRKSGRTLLITLLLMIVAPLVLASSFKNQGHPAFYPVLIAGCILGLAAIYFGFRGIRMLTLALLGKRRD